MVGVGSAGGVGCTWGAKVAEFSCHSCAWRILEFLPLFSATGLWLCVGSSLRAFQAFVAGSSSN